MTSVDHDDASTIEIRVDLHGLKEFADAIRDEVHSSVRPQTRLLLDVYGDGACFGGGWWPSLDVRQAQERYSTCLAGIEELLDTHLRAAERMALAADAIARTYGSTDALAAASADDVDRAFIDARTRVGSLPHAGGPGAGGGAAGAPLGPAGGPGSPAGASAAGSRDGGVLQ